MREEKGKPKMHKAVGGAIPPEAGYKKGGKVEKNEKMPKGKKKLAMGGVGKIRHEQYD